MLFTGNEAGGKVSLIIIFKGINVWDEWIADACSGYPDTMYCATKMGWMKSNIFKNFMIEQFIPMI